MPRRAKGDETTIRFGEAIKAAREARDESLETVARRVPSLDPKYLASLEGGWHSPTISTAKRLADALETSLAELVRDI
ncbi:MAG: helix-turn-helix domain-containing protein [Solirubrobacteraceae bacterium]